MTVLSPAVTLPTRQVIVAGRAAERFTERGLDVADAVLIWQVGPAEGELRTTFVSKPGGYFALQLDPTQDYPDFAGAGSISLELTLTLRDGSAVVTGATVSEADLTPVARMQTIASQSYPVMHLPGAPVTLDVQRDPAPVMLDGQVLTNGNPATPGSGLDVTMGGTGPFTTDAEGRFRTGLLPLTATVAVSITNGTDTTNLTQVLDFGAPLNRTTYAFEPDPD